VRFNLKVIIDLEAKLKRKEKKGMTHTKHTLMYGRCCHIEVAYVGSSDLSKTHLLMSLES
jgi:hypothetical protein